MKNKILNRVIATIGVTAVLFGSLTGCGSTSSGTDSEAGVSNRGNQGKPCTVHGSR